MMSASRRAFEAETAPPAIGPYSHAVAAGELLFLSGQIPLDPATNDLTGADDVSVQTRQVLTNLGAVLSAAGSGYNQVVKTTVYLTDLEDFGEMNSVYAEFFPAPSPARACVEVKALPKGARVEIDAMLIHQTQVG